MKKYIGRSVGLTEKHWTMMDRISETKCMTRNELFRELVEREINRHQKKEGK